MAIGLALLLVLALVTGGGYYRASTMSADYQQARAKLKADLSAAQKNGLTATDVGGITSQLDALDGSRPVLPTGVRLTFDRNDAAALDQLDGQLKTLEQQVLTTATGDATSQITAVEAELANNQQLGTPDSDMAPLRQRLADLNKAKATAATVKDWRDIGAKASALKADAAAASANQVQENTAIEQAAATLVQQAGGDVGKVQALGKAALASGRNDATVAAYEAKPGRFPKIDSLMTYYNRIEFYAPKVASGDIKQASSGTAAIQRYGGRVHQMLMDNLGPKHIIVSFQDQHVWYYENGQAVRDQPVTTGIRGITDYGTDFGPMKVLSRQHPFKFHSPWPTSSRYWYPDTTVQWTVFFTNSGESFHDAPWEPDYLLGPGSQYNSSTRSHGCIHVPIPQAQWVYDWSVEGTPVDVYPANGQPVAEQLSEITTDDQGNPINPA